MAEAEAPATQYALLKVGGGWHVDGRAGIDWVMTHWQVDPEHVKLGYIPVKLPFGMTAPEGQGGIDIVVLDIPRYAVNKGMGHTTPMPDGRRPKGGLAVRRNHLIPVSSLAMGSFLSDPAGYVVTLEVPPM